MNICLVDIVKKVRYASGSSSAHFVHHGRSTSKFNILTLSK
jgi:hypothetical protein